MCRAHGACEASSRREEEAMSMHIVDDEQRRDRPQHPCALRVAAVRRHLRRWRSSTMYTDIACVAPPCICLRTAATRHILILGQAPRTGAPSFDGVYAACRDNSETIRLNCRYARQRLGPSAVIVSPLESMPAITFFLLDMGSINSQCGRRAAISCRN
jgi:hypothetical protein